MSNQLAADVMLNDVLSKVPNAKEYVRRVLANMAEFKKANGAVVVRLGTTGKGVAPHYRLQKDTEAINTVLASAFGEEDAYYLAFSGLNHKQLPWGEKELKDGNWSTKASTYEDVSKLLGQLRGIK